MRLADNMDRHKLSDEFEFKPDQTDRLLTLELLALLGFSANYLPFSAKKKKQHI